MFLRNLVGYSAANLVVQALQFVQGMIVRSLLPPALMGVWNYVGVVVAGAATFDLGIMAAASRDLPLLHGAGRREEESTMRATAFWSRLAQSMVLGGGMMVWAAFAAAHGNRLAWPVAAAAALLALLSACNESLGTFCQSQERYVTLGMSNVFGAAASAVLLPLGAWLAGVRGLVVGAMLGLGLQLVQLVWRTRREGLTVAWTWRWPALRALLGYGVPMRLVDYPLAVFMILDVLVVTRLLEAGELAVYATAKIMVAMAIDIPSRMGNVYLSRLYVQCGAGADRRELGDELARYLMAQYLVVMPLVICVVWWFASLVIPLFIPKYADTLPVAQMLLMTIFFVPQTSLMRNFWMIDKRFGAILRANVLGLSSLAAALVAAVAWLGTSLQAVAWGCVAGYGMFFLVKIALIGREVFGLRVAAKIAGAAVGTMLWTGLVLRFSGNGAPGGEILPFIGKSLGLLAGTLVMIAPVVAVGVWWARLPDLWSSLRARI